MCVWTLPPDSSSRRSQVSDKLPFALRARTYIVACISAYVLIQNAFNTFNVCRRVWRHTILKDTESRQTYICYAVNSGHPMRMRAPYIHYPTRGRSSSQFTTQHSTNQPPPVVVVMLLVSLVARLGSVAWLGRQSSFGALLDRSNTHARAQVHRNRHRRKQPR